MRHTYHEVPLYAVFFGFPALRPHWARIASLSPFYSEYRSNAPPPLETRLHGVTFQMTCSVYIYTYKAAAAVTVHTRTVDVTTEDSCVTVTVLVALQKIGGVC